MTRKRFVKLLMADGYSRNHANSIAREAIADGCTYEFQLLLLRVGNNFPDVAFPELKYAIAKVVDEIKEILPTIINAIVELFPVAIDQARKRLTTLQEEMEVNHEQIR
jgi:hypothetical protein